MKLYARPESPFVRKVRVAAMETGLGDALEVVMMKTPEEPPQPASDHNPVGNIPTLVLDDGSVISDSRVIAEYLDTLHDREKLFPLPGGGRWEVLRLQALGDRIGEAAVMAGAEHARSEDGIGAPSAANHLQEITHGTLSLEENMGLLVGPLNIGQIAVACGLGYVDFKLTGFDWREDRPDLAVWAEDFDQRPSMQQTFFEGPVN